MRAQAFWTIAPNRGELRSVPARTLEEGELRVKAIASAISRGTESLVFQGRVPESEWQRMRAPLQDGDFPFPVKYGYAAVGQVIEGPSERLGEIVFALHPHQSDFILPASLVQTVPGGVPPRRATLAANMETALNALWDAPPMIGDRIAVVGAGTLGCLIGGLAASIPGVSVTLIDPNAERGPVARALGCAHAVPGATEPESFDLTVHTSATASGLAEALSLAADETTVLEASWYGAGAVPVALGGGFHSRRLRLVSTQVGQVAPARRNRVTYGQRLAKALALLADPRFDALTTHDVAFADLPACMAEIAGPGGPPSDLLTQTVRYG